LHVAEEGRRRPPPAGEDRRARDEQVVHALAVGRQGAVGADHSLDLHGGRRTLEDGSRSRGGDLLLHQGGDAREQGVEVLVGQIE
jgi:hypothetical protein